MADVTERSPCDESGMCGLALLFHCFFDPLQKKIVVFCFFIFVASAVEISNQFNVCQMLQPVLLMHTVQFLTMLI